MSEAMHHLANARALCAETSQALDRAAKALEALLERGVEGAVEQGVQRPVQAGAEPCPHRRAHRRGRPSKIDADAALLAFVRARIDRLTFAQLEAEIAAAFPPERRASRSSVHRWWLRNRAGLLDSDEKRR